jgi:hypothetical protein
VWGSAGIMLAVKNVQIFNHIDSIRYNAPGDPSYPIGDPRRASSGYIEFQDFMMHGIGNPAKFNYDFGTNITESGIILIDVGEPQVAPVNDWSGTTLDPDDPANQITRGMLWQDVPVWDQELGYTIGNISFYDPTYPVIGSAVPVDLGSLEIGLIDMPRFSTITSPPIGGHGVDFQHSFQMTIDKIAYAYNTTNCNSLELCTIYIGGNFVDALDDPATPSSWMPNRSTPVDFGDFQIGDIFGDLANGVYSNPAGIDVGECNIYGTSDVYGALALTLPMEGSIRFESATWMTDRLTNTFTDFGPGAIDGIQVHRLDLKLIP